jgi:N-methylhydantoinase A
MATGGAGPVHAWAVAKRLGISRVVCPPGAGAGSTIGMLMAPARVDRVAHYGARLDAAEPAEMGAILGGLEREGLAVLKGTGARIDARSATRLADMRYVGQGSEITIALPGDLSRDGVRAGFEAAYKRLFGRTPPGAAIEFVALRLSLAAPMPGAGGTLDLPRHARGTALKGRRRVYFPESGAPVEAAVYDRYALSAGDVIAGPAVFEENESTFVIGPGATARLLPDGSILAEGGAP